jgi:hypothetical protein
MILPARPIHRIRTCHGSQTTSNVLVLHVGDNTVAPAVSTVDEQGL